MFSTPKCSQMSPNPSCARIGILFPGSGARDGTGCSMDIWHWNLRDWSVWRGKNRKGHRRWIYGKDKRKSREDLSGSDAQSRSRIWIFLPDVLWRWKRFGKSKPGKIHLFSAEKRDPGSSQTQPGCLEFRGKASPWDLGSAFQRGAGMSWN